MSRNIIARLDISKNKRNAMQHATVKAVSARVYASKETSYRASTERYL